MANKKISALTSATTPLAGTEVLPIVQGGATVKVAVSDLTAGRNVSMADLTTTGNTILGNASTDTLNVGNGDLIKDASGNVGIGVTPSAWFGLLKVLQFGGTFSGTTRAGALASQSNDNVVQLFNNVYVDSSNVERYFVGGGVSKYRQNNNIHEWYTAASGTAGNPVTFTQVMVLNNAGALSLSSDNLSFGTSGKGIDFSATPGTGTSELLNDYEEGTWTPVIAGSSTAGTYTYSSVQAGQYTKVGRMVTATCSLYSIGVTSAGTGGLIITGLPFTASSNSANDRGLIGVAWLRNFSTARNNIITILSGTTIYVSYDNNGTGGGTDYPVTDIVTTSSQIGCTVVYYV
jgi:hypothetical protein